MLGEQMARNLFNKLLLIVTFAQTTLLTSELFWIVKNPSPSRVTISTVTLIVSIISWNWIYTRLTKQ
jgi:hypothetical protein